MLRLASLGPGGFALLIAVILCETAAPSSARGALSVSPPAVRLAGNHAVMQLLVTPAAAGSMPERAKDLTAAAKFISSNPKIVRITHNGRLHAVANGRAQIVVTAGGETSNVSVQVTDVVAAPKISFQTMVRPVISKAGCNTGLCHAAQHGQGHLKLSIFGFEPEKDFLAITRQHGQRRINLLRPEQSLLLLKATGEISHGGGRRFSAGSVHYRILHDWIAAGSPASDKVQGVIKELRVKPARRIAELSYAYRTLGLGYANIGALLMVKGIAYDSDEGRAMCAAITALMTGVAYATSAEMAGEMGPFPGFAANREPMLRVMRNHARAAAGAAEG